MSVTDADNAFAELPETHLEKMDRLEMEHNQRLEVESLKQSEQTKRVKYELRKARQDTWQVVAMTMGVAAVILAIIAAIYFHTSGPDSGPSDKQIEQQRETACIQGGGGWVPKGLLDQSAQGMCVFPGQRATATK